MSREWDCHCWMHYPNPLHKHKNGKWKCVDCYECIRDLVEPNTNYYDKATHCRRKDKMYKSPVEVICGDVESKVKEQQENLIYEAVVATNVNVDKEELIRALNYDRDQFDEGYKDGYRIGKDAGRREVIETLRRFVDENDY